MTKISCASEGGLTASPVVGAARGDENRGQASQGKKTLWLRTLSGAADARGRTRALLAECREGGHAS